MLKAFYASIALALVSTFFGSTYFINEKTHQLDPLRIQHLIDKTTLSKETRILLTSGTFELIAPLKLSSCMTLEALGNVVLTKKPCKKFACQKISEKSIRVLTNVSLLKEFVPGSCVTLGVRGQKVTPPSHIHTISSISRNVFHFEQPIPACNFIALDFPLITCDGKENITIKNLTLDLKKDPSKPIDILFSPGVEINYCHNIHISNCKILNFPGTALNLFNSHYVDIYNSAMCNGNIGVHIGTLNQEKEETAEHTTLRNCLFEQTQTGIFFGQGAQQTLCKNLTIQSCDLGVSMGHRNDHNTFEGCLLDNNYHGFYFRKDLGFPIYDIEFSSVEIKNSRNSDLNLQTRCYIKGLEGLSFSPRKVVNPFLLYEY